MNAMTTCENCGTTIGKLETPCVYDDRVVCSACHKRLVVNQQPPNPPGQPNRVPASTKLCPRCHQPGVMVRGLQGMGEIFTFVCLFALFMLPAIFYYIAMESRPYCPTCERRI